jgi:hypothetical protein
VSVKARVVLGVTGSSVSPVTLIPSRSKHSVSDPNSTQSLFEKSLEVPAPQLLPAYSSLLFLTMILVMVFMSAADLASVVSDSCILVITTD